MTGERWPPLSPMRDLGRNDRDQHAGFLLAAVRAPTLVPLVGRGLGGRRKEQGAVETASSVDPTVG